MTPRPKVFRFAGDGVQLTGERWGTAARVVVLLHGGGQTRHSWARTAQQLAADGWSAVALDARGHGDSGWHPRGDYELDGFVADLLAYIEALKQPPVLVGASLGGMTALMVASGHPEIIRAVVLVDVVVRIEAAGVSRIRDFMTAAPRGFATLEEVADAIVAYNPQRKRPRNLDGLSKNVRRGDDGRWYWHWDPAFMRIDDEPQRRFDPERLAAAAARLSVPVLIVRGAQSDVVSLAGLQDMLALVPHAHVVDIKAAGHMVAGDDNNVFSSALDSFLEGLDA